MMVIVVWPLLNTDTWYDIYVCHQNQNIIFRNNDNNNYIERDRKVEKKRQRIEIGEWMIDGEY